MERQQAMSDRQTSKVVIVTGGANGLGLGVVKRFVRDGASVWIADIDERTSEIAREVGATEGIICDVSQSARVEAVVDAAVERHGRLDVMVANAGIGGGAPVIDLSDELYRKVLAVNLDGVFYSCRAAARVMVGQRSGVIVTVSSVFGRDGAAGSSAYSAAKAGVIGLTQSLAKELAPLGIRVNAIAPGHMGTDLYWRAIQRRADAAGSSFDAMAQQELDQIPIGSFGTGDDVAGLVAFLSSPDAAYLTGQTINIDGGLQMR
jgi:NAD(P)-dependent dehydrogenase (short-subunit alcohol dehydrogenase family)